MAGKVADEMNDWARGFFGRPIVEDWRTQLERSTQGNLARIEMVARERLGMRQPEPADVQVVAP